MAGSGEASGRTRNLGAACVIDMSELAPGETSYEFEGHRHGGTGVSFIVVDAPPGGGPRLHRHPYDEVFVVQEGDVTFTVGDDTIEATGGQVVVVPAGVPHKFSQSKSARMSLPRSRKTGAGGRPLTSRAPLTGKVSPRNRRGGWWSVWSTIRDARSPSRRC
jgi:quercetin dioxygenase-like cupin family protein